MSYAIVIFTLAIASFHCGAAQSYTSCKDLPQLYIPFFEPIIDNSPYNYDLGTDTLRCAAKVFTNPPRGDQSFDVFAILIKKTSVTVYKAKINDDRTSINATICDSGISQTWYVSKVNYNADGLNYCFHVCDGDKIQEFGCASNNRAAFQGEQNQLLDQIKNVPGADLIKDSDDSCYGNNYCPVFT
ncbi:hypothetical protein CHUAL_005133 [Chamberlinius hualienensis]